jgi:hypothetical protein
VTTARLTETPPDHPLHTLASDTVVRLEPLAPEDVEPLGIPRLYASTGGHPRFVAEALRCGAAAPSRTLVEALIAQCRAEGAWAFRVLTTASLLDQPFELEPLAELLAADAGALGEELERLCERRILRVDGMRFRFRFDLVRQVLLDSISPARQRLLRRRLHAGTPAGGRAGGMLSAVPDRASR